MYRTMIHRAQLTAIVVLAFGSIACGAPLTWNIDSSQSYLQLVIPDQPISINGIPSGNAFVRNQGGTYSSTWTLGNQAPIAGTLESDWQAGSHIQFIGGSHNLTAVESGAFTPDFATWNSGTSTFNPPNATAPAAFGGQFGTTQTGTLPIITPDVARFAIRDVTYDIVSAAIPLAGDHFAADSASFAVAALAGLRSNGIPSNYGTLDDVGISIGGANAPAQGTITALDATQLQLILPISVPISLQLAGGLTSTLNGTAQGFIVAYALVPEPSAVVLLAIGMALVALRKRSPALRR